MRKNRPTLQSVYEGQYEPLALRSRRPNTKRLYRTTLRAFDKFLTRVATIDDLNDATVSAFAAHRLDSGLSKFSVNKDLFNLLALWRWAHRKGIVANWPDVALETPPERAPVALTMAELARLLAAIKAEPEAPGTAVGARFWLALFLLIWDSGERIGAVMGLTWDRVDIPGRWVRFRAEDRKGARADKMAKIADDTAAALVAIRRPEGKVFVWPYSPTLIYRRMGRIMKRAGLPDSKLYKFHAIRKSMASHLKAAGGDPQRALGHENARTTKSYLDPRIAPETTDAVDLLFRPGDTPGHDSTDDRRSAG
jgi:integrase